MSRLSLYDLLIHGNTIHDQYLLKEKNQQRLFGLLQSAMHGKLSTFTNSPYTNALVKSLIEQNTKIWLNTEQINSLNYKSLKTLFLTENNAFGKFISYLKTQFGAIICPIFMTHWKMNHHAFELISRASNNKYSNMDVKITGPVIKCNMMKNKNIVFQPYLKRHKDLFHVQMKLVSTVVKKTVEQQQIPLPIKVHFNIECIAKKNYYATLHPRIMNTKWNNTFHITLPPEMWEISKQKKSANMCCGQQPETETAVSITTAIMIHNADDFGDVADIDTENLMLLADMTASTHSYTVPDILSTFYGISNSVVSVLDSISDIVFIVFLHGFSELQNYEDIELETTTKITNVLMVLSIGNLISVAIAISFYITSKTSIQLDWQKNMMRFLLILLSPCIAAFDWILQKIQTYNTDVLILSPECDGILLWFEQELVKNQIFVIESVFESCFQAVIQFMAVFVLKGLIYQDIYLYLSIAISLMVVVSKLILLSYNLKRIQMFFNLLCYFMDVFFALIFSV
eukprot:268777_1